MEQNFEFGPSQIERNYICVGGQVFIPNAASNVLILGERWGDFA